MGGHRHLHFPRRPHLEHHTVQRCRQHLRDRRRGEAGAGRLRGDGQREEAIRIQV